MSSAGRLRHARWFHLFRGARTTPRRVFSAAKGAMITASRELRKRNIAPQREVRLLGELRCLINDARQGARRRIHIAARASLGMSGKKPPSTGRDEEFFSSLSSNRPCSRRSNLLHIDWLCSGHQRLPTTCVREEGRTNEKVPRRHACASIPPDKQRRPVRTSQGLSLRNNVRLLSSPLPVLVELL